MPPMQKRNQRFPRHHSHLTLDSLNSETETYLPSPPSSRGDSHRGKKRRLAPQPPQDASQTLASTTMTSTFSRVSVVLRLRPPVVPKKHTSTKQHTANETPIPSLRVDPSSNVVQFNDPKGHLRQYQYDTIFHWDTTQVQVFNHSGIVPVLDAVLRDGMTGCVFAYGQTGSGKTTTMEGKIFDPQTEGLIPRSARYIFEQKQALERQLSHRGTKVSITIRASFLEIYNETCNDLLNIQNGRNLPVRFNEEQGFYVESLFVIQCDTLQDILAVIEEGIRNRKVAEHELNADSSRSHSIFTIYTETTTSVGGFSSVKHGKINIVDLCGSERLKKSRSAKHHRTETKHINKSLLTLGQVISSLSDPRKKDQHIRYRDSKLTCLLADSLGGTSACIMIATITPTVEQLDETVNTLNYANKAKNIQNKPQIPEDTSDDIIVQLQQQIQQLREENENLRHAQQLQQFRPPVGGEAFSNHTNSPNNAAAANVTSLPPPSGGSRTTPRSLVLRNPLHPNAVIRSRPAKLKPLPTQRLPSPVMSPIDSPRTQNGALTDRSEASEMPTGGYYPVNARFGRIIAERDRLEQEIAILKSKLENSRGDSAGSTGLTPRRDLLVRPPSEAGSTNGSPVRRRFKSFLEEENKILKERVQELESQSANQVNKLKRENKYLRGLLKQHGIAFLGDQESGSEDDTDLAPSMMQPPSPAVKKHVNPRRPRKPVDVDMPQLPTLRSTGGSTINAEQTQSAETQEDTEEVEGTREDPVADEPVEDDVHNEHESSLEPDTTDDVVEQDEQDQVMEVSADEEQKEDDQKGTEQDEEAIVQEDGQNEETSAEEENNEISHQDEAPLNVDTVPAADQTAESSAPAEGVTDEEPVHEPDERDETENRDVSLNDTPATETKVDDNESPEQEESTLPQDNAESEHSTTNVQLADVPKEETITEETAENSAEQSTTNIEPEDAVSSVEENVENQTDTQSAPEATTEEQTSPAEASTDESAPVVPPQEEDQAGEITEQESTIENE